MNKAVCDYENMNNAVCDLWEQLNDIVYDCENIWIMLYATIKKHMNRFVCD